MWSSFGSLLFLLPLLAHDPVRREAFRYYRSGPFLFSALLADELFDFLGRASLIFAYAIGSVALASSVAALQPFITLIYVLLLGIFMPGILKEELDPRTLALKISALFLIVAGVYLVS